MLVGLKIIIIIIIGYGAGNDVVDGPMSDCFTTGLLTHRQVAETCIDVVIMVINAARNRIINTSTVAATSLHADSCSRCCTYKSVLSLVPQL